MKYAVLGPQKGINRISDTEPQHVPEQATVVQIADEQASQVEVGRTSTPRVIYFFIEGQLKTLQEKMEMERAAREASRPKPPYTAEQWIARQIAPGQEQFVSLRTHGLKEFEDNLKAANKTAPKLAAVRSWINTIMGLYATDLQARSDWPVIPHGFEETVQEAAYVLSQQ